MAMKQPSEASQMVELRTYDAQGNYRGSENVSRLEAELRSRN